MTRAIAGALCVLFPTRGSQRKTSLPSTGVVWPRSVEGHRTGVRCSVAGTRPAIERAEAVIPSPTAWRIRYLSQWGGSPPLISANRYAGMSPSFNGRRQPSRGGTSRINREVYVRFCERLGVKIPGPTRQNRERRDTSMARLLIPRQRTNRCSAAHASRQPGVPPLQVVAGGRNSMAFG